MTDRRRSSSTPLEWRLYVATALAGVYVVSWLAIAPTAPHDDTPPPAEVAPAPAVASPPPGPPVVLQVPAGWRVVTPGETPTAAPAPATTRPVRAPARRPTRVRTRSS